MNLAETFRGLVRRWYIVVPGLILAIAVALGASVVVKPGYERTASQLLLPGTQSVPEQGNPFLFLGGLTNAADVLVRAVGADNVLRGVQEQFPGVEVEVTRDGTVSGPMVLIKVTATSDEQAADALSSLVDQTGTILASLQDGERIPADNRISVVPITLDETSMLQQRDRLVISVGAGLAVALLAVLLTSFIDGLTLQRRRRGADPGATTAGDLAEPGEPIGDEYAESTDTVSDDDAVVSATDGEVDDHTRPLEIVPPRVGKTSSGRVNRPRGGR